MQNKNTWLEFINEITGNRSVFNKILLYTAIVILVIFFLPFLLTRNGFESLDFTATGNIGDTIGGITAPFIGILVAFLTFIAFWVQYNANQEQRKDIRRDRFESKYYKLLDIHIANLNSMEIDNKIHGRKCFSYMFYEFRIIYKIVEKSYIKKYSKSQREKFESQNYSILNLSYSIFFSWNWH